jgi:tryptophan-rich sensory protein
VPTLQNNVRSEKCQPAKSANPYPSAFPIIWSTIALLRAASSVAIFAHVVGGGAVRLESS